MGMGCILYCCRRFLSIGLEITCLGAIGVTLGLGILTMRLVAAMQSRRVLFFAGVMVFLLSRAVAIYGALLD
jgi:hypothetical protein